MKILKLIGWIMLPIAMLIIMIDMAFDAYKSFKSKP